MSLSEFDLIDRYFRDLAPGRVEVALGIGDDGAVIDIPPDRQIVLAVDTLVAGVHFPEDAPPEAIGHKALAVNLSDLAAMGADPAFALLSLTVPNVDKGWLAGFAAGFGHLARRHSVALVGGDTTRGPLSVTVQVTGLIPTGRSLTRGGARPGDRIFVTGTLGDAALGLDLWRSGERSESPARAELVQRLHRPEPRLEWGGALRGLAHAAIDISDGLLADLGHVLATSGCGAAVDVDAVPLSAAFLAEYSGERPPRPALNGGDDYELCFTVPEPGLQRLDELAGLLDTPITAVGWIERTPGLRLVRADGASYEPGEGGYDHFRRSGR